MKYDDASWHYGGTFPDDLPKDAGGTHAGMFLAWALIRGMAGRLHTRQFPEQLALLQARGVTPGQFLLQHCDGKFTDEDLDKTGNAFTRVYYEADGALFLADYDAVLTGNLASTYHVADTWTNFDLLAPALDFRLEQWRAGSLGGELPATLIPRKRPWWKWN